MSGDLFEFWNKWRETFARLDVGGCSHCLERCFLFCKAREVALDS